MQTLYRTFIAILTLGSLASYADSHCYIGQFTTTALKGTQGKFNFRLRTDDKDVGLVTVHLKNPDAKALGADDKNKTLKEIFPVESFAVAAGPSKRCACIDIMTKDNAVFIDFLTMRTGWDKPEMRFYGANVKVTQFAACSGT